MFKCLYAAYKNKSKTTLEPNLAKLSCLWFVSWALCYILLRQKIWKYDKSLFVVQSKAFLTNFFIDKMLHKNFVCFFGKQLPLDCIITCGEIQDDKLYHRKN